MADATEPQEPHRASRRLGVALWSLAAAILLVAIWGTLRGAGPTNRAAPTPLAPPTLLPEIAATNQPVLAPAPAPRSLATSRPARRTPTAAPTAAARPVQYWIRFGPTEDLREVEALVARLSQSYAVVGRILTSDRQAGFRVVATPLRLRSAAEERRRTLAAVGIEASVVSDGDGSYRLDLGVFDSPSAAETRARQVRARGYPAVVQPNRVPVYTVVVGPAREAVALAIARTLQASGFAPTISRRP
ncbi:MAG: SPOR domain-containing protein [Armatimonadota bacterium]|nr:SPOR domain-containing protein [Armatimonadota bacterium]